MPRTIIKIRFFSCPDVRRKFVFSETYSLLQNYPKLILTPSSAPSWIEQQNSVFIHFFLPAAITLICSSIVDNVQYFLLFFIPFRQVCHKIVLNKNTWPEIVNVFLLIAVSTYSVGKNNKHFMFDLFCFFPWKPAAIAQMVDMHCMCVCEQLNIVHHFRDIFSQCWSGYYNPRMPQKFIPVIFFSFVSFY